MKKKLNALLENRWSNFIFIAFLLLLTLAIFVYYPNKKTKSYDINSENNLEEQADDFRVDNISIVRYEDNRKLFSLSADKVIHRKRISKLFVYQNLKEIYMSGVKIDIYSGNSASNKKHIAIPVDDIGRSFTSLGKPSTSMEEYLSGNLDIDLDLLTRTLIEDLSINVYISQNKKISFIAKGARINVDFENLILEGPVKIIASDGKELTSSLAVWSGKFNGIYLPEGYMMGDFYLKRKAFFTLTRKGEFSKISVIPKIRYNDVIEEKEKIFYARLFGKMPAYMRVMFGLP